MMYYLLMGMKIQKSYGWKCNFDRGGFGNLKIVVVVVVENVARVMWMENLLRTFLKPLVVKTVGYMALPADPLPWIETD